MTTERFHRRCLRDELARRLRKNPKYSLRSFARSLRIDAGALSRVLSGKKLLTPELSKKVLDHLTLSPKEERSFLLSMARAYEEEGARRKKAVVKDLLKNPTSKILERDLTPEVFRIIADWYHYAILQLMEVPDFQAKASWVAGALGIQEMEAKLAIDRLKELEIIEDHQGTWRRTSGRLTTGDSRVTTPALRKRIRQITGKSLASLENDPIDERNHTTLTMAIDPAKLPIAKEMIQEFADQLAKRLQTRKKRVYELQINLFPLQKGERKK
jgi:uncharacterized protein (TIGR02147 family)